MSVSLPKPCFSIYVIIKSSNNRPHPRKTRALTYRLHKHIADLLSTHADPGIIKHKSIPSTCDYGDVLVFHNNSAVGLPPLDFLRYFERAHLLLRWLMNSEAPEEVVLNGQKVEQDRVALPADQTDDCACHCVEYEVVCSRDDCHQNREWVYKPDQHAEHARYRWKSEARCQRWVTLIEER